MDKRQMLWQMTANQFAAFDTQLYLDTHPDDKAAMQMHSNYQKAFLTQKKEYEALYGPISADGVISTDSEAWDWIDAPWPWEKEAN